MTIIQKGGKMNDLISRQALLEKKIRIPIARVVTEDKIIYRDVVFVTDIEALPSAQPRKGKWIEHDDGWANVYYECSVCKEPFVLIDGTPTENLYNFCPNCGVDMREGDAE